MNRIALRSFLIASLALLSAAIYSGLLYHRSKPSVNWRLILFVTTFSYFQGILFITAIIYTSLFMFNRVKKVESLTDYILLKILYYLFIGVFVFVYMYLSTRREISIVFTNTLILFFGIFLFDVIFNSRFEESNNEIIIK